MSYTITLTDGQTLGTILDGTSDTIHTSLTLVGRNFGNYGQVMTNNLVALLENFSNNIAPPNPLAGQLWWDRANKGLKVYTGTTFKVISGPTASATAPSTTTAGDLWLDTVNQQLNVYNGLNPFSPAGWILVGPQYSILHGKSGAIWETIIDTSNASHDVLALYLDDTRTEIISRSSTFTPANAIPGFSTIIPGTNLSSFGTLNGTVVNAVNLGGIPSANYMRTDANNIASGIQSFNNNSGINIGGNLELSITTPSLGVVLLTNSVLNGTTAFYANVGNAAVQALTINGTTGRVEVAGDPVSALGITTKQYVDNKFNNTSLTGTPTAPTAPTITNSNQLATTAFTYAAIGPRNIIQDTASSFIVNATNASLTIANAVVLTASTSGVNLADGATAVTQGQGRNDTTIATTGYVRESSKRWDGAAKWVSTNPPSVGVNDTGSVDGDIWFQYQA